jgi:DNA-binding NtrC family response regulator
MARVLVVSDDPSVRLAFRRIISSAGHQIASAATASDGMREQASHRFDLVFLDMAIGVEAAIELMLEARDERLPVIAVPGVGPDGSEVFDPTKFGASAVLGKPFSADEIRALIFLYARDASWEVPPSEGERPFA